ncbi:MAG TPA: rRNA pseudouridine synthase [bacterium]|nr:rRNA pseudouridine synthase [bacterium]HEX68093.1 rRNA pseudouridine synthase [bacterium]
MKERLHKVIARAGITSRRKAEDLIREGRVKVDGKVVKELGFKVDPEKQKIEVDGREISFPSPVYMAFYKPRWCLSTLYDPRGRRTVKDFLKDLPERVYPVGRLDWDAEGLLLLTNDGELTNFLTHPRYGVKKVYEVLVEGVLSEEEMAKLREGVVLDGRKVIPVSLRIIRRNQSNSLFEVVLREGRYREIKRMFKAVGHKVLRIKRVKMGPISLGGLKPGEYRFLNESEKRELLLLKERLKKIKGNTSSYPSL